MAKEILQMELRLRTLGRQSILVCPDEPGVINEFLKIEMFSWLWGEGDVTMEECNLAMLLAVKMEEGGHKPRNGACL